MGVDEGDPNKRAIIKGVEQLHWGKDPKINDPSNPHKVAYVSATVKNITFKDFTWCAIWIHGGAGTNEIIDCSFEDCKYYEPPTSPPPKGAFPLLVFPAQPSELTGTLVITNCHFGAAANAPVDGLMNNVVHISDANLTFLKISNNTMDDMYWIGFGVFGIPGHTLISNNDITTKSSFNKPGAGISFGSRPPNYGKNWDGSVTIENNRITVKSPPPPIASKGSYGVVVFRYGEDEYGPHVGWTDRDVTVCDNVVKIIGANQVAALACVGACSNSRWTGNEVSGSAQFGILFSDISVNGIKATGALTENVFEWNKFDDFTASCAQVYIPSGVSHYVLEENSFGPVAGSNHFGWPPPLDPPCHAGIACFGSDGKLLCNHFAKSGIQGWWSAPPISPTPGGVTPPPDQQLTLTKVPPDPRVGCIYLDENTYRNLILFRRTDFPPGTALPSWERQILDVDTSQWRSLFVMKRLGSENKIIEIQRMVPTKPRRPLVRRPAPGFAFR